MFLLQNQDKGHSILCFAFLFLISENAYANIPFVFGRVSILLRKYPFLRSYVVVAPFAFASPTVVLFLYASYLSYACVPNFFGLFC